MGGIDLSLQVVLYSSDHRKVSSTDFNGLGGIPRCLTWMFDDKILRTDDDDVEAITVESSMTVLSLPGMREHCGFYDFFEDATGSPWRGGDVYTIRKGTILYWLTRLYVDVLKSSSMNARVVGDLGGDLGGVPDDGLVRDLVGEGLGGLLTRRPPKRLARYAACGCGFDRATLTVLRAVVDGAGGGDEPARDGVPGAELPGTRLTLTFLRAAGGAAPTPDGWAPARFTLTVRRCVTMLWICTGKKADVTSRRA